jgi:hypothetical protein
LWLLTKPELLTDSNGPEPHQFPGVSLSAAGEDYFLIVTGIGIRSESLPAPLQTKRYPACLFIRPGRVILKEIFRLVEN